jgi:type III restriction enzyme
VNHVGAWGRWAFAEFTDVFALEPGLDAKIGSEFWRMMESVVTRTIT